MPAGCRWRVGRVRMGRVRVAGGYRGAGGRPRGRHGPPGQEDDSHHGQGDDRDDREDQQSVSAGTTGSRSSPAWVGEIFLPPLGRRVVPAGDRRPSAC